MDTLLFSYKQFEISKPKPRCLPQYRQQLVVSVQSGCSANDIAKEFGLHAATVAKWMRLDRMGTPSSVKLSSAKPESALLDANECQKLIKLRRKVMG